MLQYSSNTLHNGVTLSISVLLNIHTVNSWVADKCQLNTKKPTKSVYMATITDSLPVYSHEYSQDVHFMPHQSATLLTTQPRLIVAHSSWGWQYTGWAPVYRSLFLCAVAESQVYRHPVSYTYISVISQFTSSIT